MIASFLYVLIECLIAKLNRELNRKFMFNILCYKSKTLKNGENPLVIRVCKDGKKKYQSLGISIKPEFWNFKKNQPKANCPNREIILKIINEQVNKYNEKILSFKAEDKDFTVNSLIDNTETAANKKCTILELFDIHINQLLQEKRLRS